MSCSCRVLECAICTTSYTRSMIIKSANPQELLQNDSVRELVEACKLEYRDIPHTIMGEGFQVGSLNKEKISKALKNFEVKE